MNDIGPVSDPRAEWIPQITVSCREGGSAQKPGPKARGAPDVALSWIREEPASSGLSVGIDFLFWRQRWRCAAPQRWKRAVGAEGTGVNLIFWSCIPDTVGGHPSQPRLSDLPDHPRSPAMDGAVRGSVPRRKAWLLIARASASTVTAPPRRMTHTPERLMPSPGVNLVEPPPANWLFPDNAIGGGIAAPGQRRV